MPPIGAACTIEELPKDLKISKITKYRHREQRGPRFVCELSRCEPTTSVTFALSIAMKSALMIFPLCLATASGFVMRCSNLGKNIHMTDQGQHGESCHNVMGVTLRERTSTRVSTRSYRLSLEGLNFQSSLRQSGRRRELLSC